MIAWSQDVIQKGFHFKPDDNNNNNNRVVLGSQTYINTDSLLRSKALSKETDGLFSNMFPQPTFFLVIPIGEARLFVVAN